LLSAWHRYDSFYPYFVHHANTRVTINAVDGLRACVDKANDHSIRTQMVAMKEFDRARHRMKQRAKAAAAAHPAPAAHSVPEVQVAHVETTPEAPQLPPPPAE